MKKPLREWSFFGVKNRTTNVAEGYHSALTRAWNSARRPSLPTFLHLMHSAQAARAHKFHRLWAGGKVKRRNNKYVLFNETLMKYVQQCKDSSVDVTRADDLHNITLAFLDRIHYLTNPLLHLSRNHPHTENYSRHTGPEDSRSNPHSTPEVHHQQQGRDVGVISSPTPIVNCSDNNPVAMQFRLVVIAPALTAKVVKESYEWSSYLNAALKTPQVNDIIDLTIYVAVLQSQWPVFTRHHWPI